MRIAPRHAARTIRDEVFLDAQSSGDEELLLDDHNAPRDRLASCSRRSLVLPFPVFESAKKPLYLIMFAFFNNSVAFMDGFFLQRFYNCSERSAVNVPFAQHVATKRAVHSDGVESVARKRQLALVRHPTG